MPHSFFVVVDFVVVVTNLIQGFDIIKVMSLLELMFGKTGIHRNKQKRL